MSAHFCKDCEHHGKTISTMYQCFASEFMTQDLVLGHHLAGNCRTIRTHYPDCPHFTPVER
jgi:hypothetical protein